MKGIKGLLLCCMICAMVGIVVVSCKEKCEIGVSAELAQKRKQKIKYLKYELRFDIPESKTETVKGRVNIVFYLEETDDVILDFCQPDCMLNNYCIEVNGEHISSYKAENEHIIIEKDCIVTGKNTISIDFEVIDQSINRNDEFLYTLLVPDRARTLFPCFDQPNLKAEYTLCLDVPADWEAVANSPVAKQYVEGESKRIYFHPTEPLSTYLFSFVAGKFEKVTYKDNQRTLTAYHRETDPKRIAQLDEIFSQVAESLRWLENYTGIAYPFAKYDFVILPGFQYGGMEHTGATLYNDTRIFLSENPTAEEKLQRIQLIAHETAHMWFGDYVTMDWFDDVWTKEVFANYFAARISEPLYPGINHKLNWLKMTVIPALKEDRTAGTNAIKQSLDNLSDAGLLYGNIIYCKSPVVLNKIVEIIGDKAFHDGVAEYLKTYAYGNATWEDLINILDKRTDFDLKSFSQVWVHEKGMPRIETRVAGGVLKITQNDPLGRNLVWPQNYDIMLVGDSTRSISVEHHSQCVEMEVGKDVVAVLPNSDGRGYGHFVIDDKSRKWIIDNWTEINDETLRMSLLISLHENHWNKLIADDEWSDFLLTAMSTETNELIFASMCSYLSEVMSFYKSRRIEETLMQISGSHPIASCRLQSKRVLYAHAVDKDVVAALYHIWHNADDELLSENDYTNMAYELALRYPDKCDEILSTQRSRIKNVDRLRQFDFISQAVDSDVSERDLFFESLMEPSNRVTEPWVATALSYLNHYLHQPDSRRYIRRGLNELQEIQSTGDIFFPRNWTIALLGNYHDKKALKEVNTFLKHNSTSPLLTNKILQAIPYATDIDTKN